MRRIILFAASLLLFNATPASAGGSLLPFELKQVAPGVYAAIDGPLHEAGSNSGFVIGDDGVVVVDAFFTGEAARSLIAEIHRLTPKPIRYVVNTHYHVDHTGGDEALRDDGAIVIAHPNVRAWVRTNNIKLMADRMTPALKTRIENLPLPDVVTDKDLTLWLGSRKVVVRSVEGHTGGDLVVFVPDADVLFTGDLLWRKIAPNLVDGSVKEWIATVSEFERMPAADNVIFVPGHGDVARAADVHEFRSYLVDLERLVRRARANGLSDGALPREVLPKLRALHPGWTINDRSGALEVRYMDEELAGTKRRPVPPDE